MSSWNLMLSLGAFALLTTILVSSYGNLALGGETITNAQAGLNQLTYATTYMELANGLAFDEFSVDSFLTTLQLNNLTAPLSLGPENPVPLPELTESGFTTFDDIDDLHNFTIVDSSLLGISGVFKTSFKVYYVDPLSLNQAKTTRTFVKRVDMTVVRVSPPSKDTLRHSMFMGYFHFD